MAAQALRRYSCVGNTLVFSFVWVRFLVLQTEQGDGKHRLYPRGRRKASLRLPRLPVVLGCQAGIRKLAFLMPPP